MLRGVAKYITGQGQQGRRTGRVSHDLGSVGGGQLAQLHFPRRIHRGINENSDTSLRNQVGKFGVRSGKASARTVGRASAATASATLGPTPSSLRSVLP